MHGGGHGWHLTLLSKLKICSLPGEWGYGGGEKGCDGVVGVNVRSGGGHWEGKRGLMTARCAPSSSLILTRMSDLIVMQFVIFICENVLYK